MIFICLGSSDAAQFSAMISQLLMNLLPFHFLVFFTYAAHRIIRRIFR